MKNISNESILAAARLRELEGRFHGGRETIYIYIYEHTHTHIGLTPTRW